MPAHFIRLGYFAKSHPSCSAPRCCIALMVALAPTIPRVSPPLSPISISTPSVPSFVLLWVAPPLDLAMHPPMHSLKRDHATTPRRSLSPLSFMKLLFVEGLLLNMCGPLHMILPLESRDLSLLDIYPVGATSLFNSETTIPLDYSDLLNKLRIVLPPANALARLRFHVNTAPAAPLKA